MRCISSVKTASPFANTVGIEGDASAVAETIFPDSRVLVNLNTILAVGLVIGPL